MRKRTTVAGVLSLVGAAGPSVLVASCSEEFVWPVGSEECVAEPQQGAWDPNLLNWIDVGAPGADVPKQEPWHDIQPHHAFLVAVHAAHLPSGELILYHGEGETRVWPIGTPPEQMRWHPVPFDVPQANPDLCSYQPVDPSYRCFADIFCSGQVVLPDGRLFVAGGNVEGNAGGGGLSDMFLFDPADADQDVFPFGWARSNDTMEVDRWYPTLTVIPGATPQVSPFGRVLIVSGATRTLGGASTPIFELYDADPEVDQVTTLTIQGESPFNSANPMPLYPFMFLLPNGDIFFAGGEDATENTRRGRVLIPDYNNGGTWAWHPRIFESSITGGSAVMYAPGKIMKSGGLAPGDDQLAHQITETIDLSNTTSGNYTNAPDFVVTAPMARARHFHTLTLLPDGRVVATGGNSRGNGRVGDHTSYDCD